MKFVICKIRCLMSWMRYNFYWYYLIVGGLKVKNNWWRHLWMTSGDRWLPYSPSAGTNDSILWVRMVTGWNYYLLTLVNSQINQNNLHQNFKYVINDFQRFCMYMYCNTFQVSTVRKQVTEINVFVVLFLSKIYIWMALQQWAVKFSSFYWWSRLFVCTVKLYWQSLCIF